MPAQAASPATYGVTISATSPNYPGAVHGKVLGFALVIYKDTKENANTATVSGNVTGASSGDTATLLAKPFGAASFKPAPVQPVTLTGAPSQSLAFGVQPSVATTYEIQVTTGATVDATSAHQTVYVTETGGINHLKEKCHGLKCTITYRLYEILPSSGRITESKKHIYLYQMFFTGTTPAKSFTLATSATASKAVKINAGEFENVITFHVKFRNRTQHWLPASCTKDSENLDGLGLPGRHGCGAKRFSSKAVYLG